MPKPSDSTETPYTISLRRIVGIGVLLHLGLVLLLVGTGYYAISADESLRTLEAYQWAHSQSQGFSVWLPFHRVVVGVALRLHEDLFVTPRLVSILFGLLNLAAVAALTETLFGKREVTALSVYLAAVHAPCVVLSAVPLAESMFVAVALAGLACLAVWMRKSTLPALAAACLLIGLSGTIRYEGWLMAGALFVVLVLSPRRTARELFWCGVVLFAFPVGWMLHCHAQTTSLIGFMGPVADRYSLRHGDSLVALMQYNVLTQLLILSCVSGSVIGSVSLLGAWRTQPDLRRWFVVPAVALFSLVTLGALGRGLPSHNFWRPAAVFAVLLVPFTAETLDRLVRGNSNLSSPEKRCLVSAFLLMFLYQCYQFTYSGSHFRADDSAMGTSIRRVLTESREESSKVLIEVEDWNFAHVIVASRSPSSFVANSASDPLAPGPRILEPSRALPRAELSRLKVRYVVVSSGGMRRWLDDCSPCKLLERVGRWSLYEIR